MDEQALVKCACKGDHDAFLALLAKYDRQIMSVVFRFTGDLFDREDLYQDIFLHCYRSIKKYRFDESFQNWLYRVALNRCIHFNKKKDPAVAQQDIAAAPPDWERREKMKAIRKAMSRLKGPQQICFHLYYIEDWDLQRIADVLGCARGTIKSHLDRARAKIKSDREVLLWQTNP